MNGVCLSPAQIRCLVSLSRRNKEPPAGYNGKVALGLSHRRLITGSPSLPYWKWKPSCHGNRVLDLLGVSREIEPEERPRKPQVLTRSQVIAIHGAALLR